MRSFWLALSMPLSLGLASCETAKLPPSADVGPHPTLPAPEKSLLPTLKVAPAKGWPADAKPAATSGLEVARFAGDLQHPRSVYVLPNGDVLVAETDAPPKPEDGKGIRGWIYKMAQKRAGASHPSANRITLLRDGDGDGKVDTRTSSSKDSILHSAWRSSAAISTSPTPTP